MTDIFVRLPRLAKAINMKAKGYTATIEKAYTNTDRKHGRIRVPGKGRRGNKLTVTNVDGVRMFDHDASRGGSNDSICFTVESLWGPIWEEDVKVAKPLVCRACKTPESAKNPGHYIYQWFTSKVLCPDCNKQYEAGTLKI